ncbi:MAG: hypothetical protein ACOY0T_32055 [Myxococcota bacterium]
MKPPNPPKGIRDAADDPLLPFVVAAKAGDRGAERELLSRVAPTVLAVARAAGATEEKQLSALVLEALIATLKALPTFRGDEIVRDVVARIALEKAKLALGTLVGPDARILAAAKGHAVRATRSGDASRISVLVERALQDDAAVLVSHVMLRTKGKRSKRHTYTWRGALVVGLAVVGTLWLASRIWPSATPWIGP